MGWNDLSTDMHLQRMTSGFRIPDTWWTNKKGRFFFSFFPSGFRQIIFPWARNKTGYIHNSGITIETFGLELYPTMILSVCNIKHLTLTFYSIVSHFGFCFIQIKIQFDTEIVLKEALVYVWISELSHRKDVLCHAQVSPLINRLWLGWPKYLLPTFYPDVGTKTVTISDKQEVKLPISLQIFNYQSSFLIFSFKISCSMRLLV